MEKKKMRFIAFVLCMVLLSTGFIFNANAVPAQGAQTEESAAQLPETDSISDMEVLTIASGSSTKKKPYETGTITPAADETSEGESHWSLDADNNLIKMTTHEKQYCIP